MSGQNASQQTTNATLAYAQVENEDTNGMTEGLGNDTGRKMEGQTDPNGEGEVELGTGGP